MQNEERSLRTLSMWGLMLICSLFVLGLTGLAAESPAGAIAALWIPVVGMAVGRAAGYPDKATEEAEIILDKATVIAFCSLKKLHCTPFLKSDGRVAFRVRGNIAEVLADLAENPRVHILDYLNRLDAVRSVIFSMKDGGSRSNRGVATM